MEITEILEQVEPLAFDGCTGKAEFIRTLKKFPDLKKELENELSLESNHVWIEKAKQGKFFFLIYNDSWKNLKSPFPNSINLNFIGIHNTPVISIDIHQRLA